MNKKTTLKLFLAMSFSVFLSSCSLFKEPVFERVNEVKLKDITANHTKLDLSIVIRNPNWYSITVRSLDVDVLDKSRDKLGNIKMTQPIKIKKHEADTVYFEILMDTRKVARVLSYSSDKVEFTIKADALAKALGISKRVKLEQIQEVNFTALLEDLLPSIPSEFELSTLRTSTKPSTSKTRKYEVKDPKIQPVNSSPTKPDIFKVVKTSITDFGLRETQLTVRFMLLNPYGFSFTFRDFPAEVWINDKYAGKGKLAKPMFFDENVFSADGELLFDLNNFNAILLASRTLLKRDLNYIVNGTLMVDGFGTKISKPFKFKGVVEVGKKDK